MYVAKTIIKTNNLKVSSKYEKLLSILLLLNN